MYVNKGMSLSIHIDKLTFENEIEYENLISQVPSCLIYHSLSYRNFLREILVDAKGFYILAFVNRQLVGVLPVFIKYGKFGAIANSLPFYGSYGSIILKNADDQTVAKKLLMAFEKLCKEENVLLSTIIQNPLSKDTYINANYQYDFIDQRIGQITKLHNSVNEENIEHQLMLTFHGKTRNLIRKGQKFGFDISHSGSDATMHHLYELHKANMKSINGSYKSIDIFTSIQNNFQYDRDYRVYISKKDGEVAAMLLIFFFNQTVEYFTPVINPKFRSDQPMSVLILEAMKYAITIKCKYWNWGGTWLTQKGVHHFKSRWGTMDINYKYYIKAYSNIKHIQKLNLDEILKSYPYFYVLPEIELKANDK